MAAEPNQAQLDASLSVQLHANDADDDGDDFEDDQPDAQQQQQQQHYADEEQHGEHGGDEAAMDDNGGSFMRLNLNGQHMEGTIGAPFDEHSGVDDGTGGGSVRGAAAEDEFPVFKVGECVARSRQPMSCVRCDVSAGHVFIGSYTGELVLFDFTAAREVWRRQVSVEGKPVSITCLDINKSKLAIGCMDGSTLIFDLETFQVTQCWSDHRQRVSAIAWVVTPSLETGLVYTSAHDGYFLVRDPARGGKVLHSFISCTCPLSAMIVESPNVVYVGSWDGQVKRIDLERKMVTLVLKANTIKESPIRCFALAPSPLPPGKAKKKAPVDGEAVDESLPIFVLLIAHGIGEIKSWDMRTGKVHVEAYHGSGDVTNQMVVWNSRLYSAGDDKVVRVFDVNTGQQLEILTGHEGGVMAITIAGMTPVVAEHVEGEDGSAAPAAAAAATPSAATNRSSSRGTGPKGAPQPPQQGVGDELLMTTGFDCQARAYKLAAIDAAIQMRLANAEQAKAAAFEFFLEDKKAKALLAGGSGKKKKGKGSAKGKKGGSASAKPADGASKTGSASGSKKGSKAASKAGSKTASARGTAEPGATAAAAAAKKK